MELNFSGQNLRALPELPPGLKVLKCDGNKLTFLPKLPDSLKKLHCANNRLTVLPELPYSLESLFCLNNRLTVLPELPDSLEYLHCANNQLTVLPEFPRRLRLITLDCSKNQLTVLPKLPVMLETLNCSRNQLTVLPMIPPLTTKVDCSENNISEIVGFAPRLISRNKIVNIVIDIDNLNLNSLTKYKNQLIKNIEYCIYITGNHNQTLDNINERIYMLNFKVVSGNNKEINVSGTSEAIPRGNVDLIKSYITDRVGGSRRRKSRKQIKKRSRRTNK